MKPLEEFRVRFVGPNLITGQLGIALLHDACDYAVGDWQKSPTLRELTQAAIEHKCRRR